MKPPGEGEGEGEGEGRKLRLMTVHCLYTSFSSKLLYIIGKSCTGYLN